nr:caspase recruitment domain-containing protein 19 isoform X2 [Vulpes vulpes]
MCSQRDGGAPPLGVGHAPRRPPGPWGERAPSPGRGRGVGWTAVPGGQVPAPGNDGPARGPPGLRKWREDVKVKVPSAVPTPEARPGRLGTHRRVLTSGSRPHPTVGDGPPVGGTNACPAPLTCPIVLFPEHSDCTDLDSGAMGHELSDRGPVAFLACLGLAAGLALLVYCCPAGPFAAERGGPPGRALVSLGY